MNYDYSNRSFLLPKGCKDLIEVLKPKDHFDFAQFVPASFLASLPLIRGELSVPERMTVWELAALLKQKPSRIIGDLLELGIQANVDLQIAFEIIAYVVRRYGYLARKGE